MNYVLLETTHIDWPNECTFSGFSIIKKQHWKILKKKISDLFEEHGEIDIWYGSKQYDSFHSIENFYIIEKPITLAQYNFLKKLHPDQIENHDIGKNKKSVIMESVNFGYNIINFYNQMLEYYINRQ